VNDPVSYIFVIYLIFISPSDLTPKGFFIVVLQIVTTSLN